MTAAGSQFGNYLLEERLAVGGMAEVFRARRLGAAGFSRPVCIKRILAQFCQDRSFVEMFIDEANTGAQLRHGNIVAIDDFGEVEGQFFLAMELIHGVDVARLVAALDQDNRALPWEVGTFILHEVLAALDYAHRKKAPDGGPLNVVHRDVSPHNVLVSYAGELKLTDFGIARARTRIHQTTQHVVKGKLAYMAPEQAKALDLDGRADLFAVGVSAFEWLANQRPFTGKNEPEVISNLLRGQRPMLQTLRPDVPEGVVRVIDGLLMGDRDQRIGSASEALAMLEPFVTPTSGRWLSSIVAHYFAGSNVTAARPMVGFAVSSLPEAPFREGRVKKAPAPVSQDPTQAAGPRPSGPTAPNPPLPRISLQNARSSEPVQSHIATQMSPQVSHSGPMIEMGSEIAFAQTVTPVGIPPIPPEHQQVANVSLVSDGQTVVSAVIEAVPNSDPRQPVASSVDAPVAHEPTMIAPAEGSNPRHAPTRTTMEPAIEEPVIGTIAAPLTPSVASVAQASSESAVDRSARTQTSMSPVVTGPDPVAATVADPGAITETTPLVSAKKSQEKTSDLRAKPKPPPVWVVLAVGGIVLLAIVLVLALKR